MKKKTTKAKARKAKPTVAIVRAAPAHPARRAVVVAAPARRKRRRGHGGGGAPSPLHVAIATYGLANVAEPGGIAGDAASNLIDKLPGAKTFGRPATAGIALGALYRYTKVGGRLRPYMATAGIVGIVLAVAKIAATKEFKWLGGEPQERPYAAASARHFDADIA